MLTNRGLGKVPEVTLGFWTKLTASSTAWAVLLAVMLPCFVLLPQRAGKLAADA